MEFRHPYMVAMQDQNPKLYRRLRDSGELDRLVEMKAREANQLYQKILADQPKTLQAEREAAEHVRAMMFEFPDDMMTATQEVQPEAGSHSNVFHMLARTAEQSQSKITGLPLLPGLIDEPGMFDPSEKWEEFLRMIESLPDFLLKEQIILRAKELIAEKAKGDASK